MIRTLVLLSNSILSALLIDDDAGELASAFALAPASKMITTSNTSTNVSQSPAYEVSDHVWKFDTIPIMIRINGAGQE